MVFDGSFDLKMNQLHSDRMSSLSNPDRTSAKIVISGGGPTGLMWAIQALLQGHETIVLEKRGKLDPKRFNTIQLNCNSVTLLKEYGICQYLFEKSLIFAPDESLNLSVRIGDLEQAMSAVVGHLGGSQTINYEVKIVKIDESGDKLALDLIDGRVLEKVDVLVNAEGASSTTNQLLHNERLEILPKVPVAIGVYQTEERILTASTKPVVFENSVVFKTPYQYYLGSALC